MINVNSNFQKSECKYFVRCIFLFFHFLSLIVPFHFVPQTPVDSPHVSPVTSSQSASVEEVEMNPRPICPTPSSSTHLSLVASFPSSEKALENRQDFQPLSTPERTQSPSDSSASCAERTECSGREERPCSPSLTFVLDLSERSYRVSELAAGDSCMRL